MAFVRIGNFRSAVTRAMSVLFLPPVRRSCLSSRDESAAPHKQRRSRWALKCAVLLLLVILGSAVCWATSSIVFNGVALVVSTGSFTLNSPTGLAVDPSGNLYIVDTLDNRIIEVTPAGTASVLALTGLGSNLHAPGSVAADGSGNVYIADSVNNRIVKVAGGAASVVAMGGLTVSNPLGVAVDGAGDLYISDSGHSRIVTIPVGGSASVLSITGLSTPLGTPYGLTVDAAGNVYVADTSNNRIVKVTSGGAGSALSITGLSTPLASPTGVAVDTFGNVYISDTSNGRTVIVSHTGAGSVFTTGNVTVAVPRGVTVSVAGTVYIADVIDNQVVQVMDSAVSFGELQVGANSGTTQSLPFTVGVSATVGSAQSFTVGTTSLDFTVVGSGTTCTSGTTNANCTVNVKFLPTAPGLRRGALVVYDECEDPLITVPIYGTGGAPLAALSPNVGSVINTGGLATSNPYQLALDGAGNIYVGDYTGKNVTKIPAGGGSASLVALGTPASIAVQNITGVALDGAGNLFIGDHQNSRILVVTPGGVVSVLSISGLSPSLGFPVALAVDGTGNLYIADFTSGRIVEVSTLVVSGSTSSGIGTVIDTGSYSFTGSTLTGMTVDAPGNIYIAARTQNNSSIIKVTPAGVASALAIPNNITPAISNPQGVAVDAMGNVYIVDTANSRIVKITTAGVASILSLSGLPTPSSLGSLLFGVTADSSGNVYIPDWTNNRIVFVNVSGAALTFASTNVGSTSSDSPKTATVTNLGNQALVFSANPTYTASFSNNSGDTNLCTSSTSLASGTVCDVSVNFTPQAAGSLSAGITVTNNTLNVAGSPQQVSVSGTGTAAPAPITPTIHWTQPAAISYGATLTGILDATALNGSTAVPGVFAYTSTPTGGSATTATGETVLVPDSYTLHVSFTPTDTTHYASATGSVSLTVAKSASAVALTASASSAVADSAVSFTATVSSSSGTPTGSVSFYDGTTLLGSATLAHGVATYTTSSLAAGAHSITVVYAGDSNFSSVTSSVLTETVHDFSLTLATGSSTSATASPGGTATYDLKVGPSSGTTFPGAVTLTVSGLPTGATATLTPSTLPAGAGVTNVTLAVQLPATTASLRPSELFALKLSPPFNLSMLGMLLLPFGGRIRRAFGKQGSAARLLLLALVLTPLLGLTGCASQNSGFLGNTQQTFTLTVTATSGTLSHSATVSLIVK